MLEPVGRNPLELETIQLFRRVLGPGGRLDSSDVVREFLGSLQATLDRLRSQPSILRGVRTQALFAQLVLALDACEVMLTVDAGDIYADGSVSSGDFLLVLRDGRRLLIEVKNVGRQKTKEGKLDINKSQKRMVRAKEVAGLERMASLLGAEPMYAAFFEMANIWALVSTNALEARQSNFELTFKHAMLSNNLQLLGDRVVGVNPPIEIRLYPARGQEPTVQAQFDSESAALPFVPDRRETVVGGVLVHDSEDAEFAAFLAVFGGWEHEIVPEVSDGHLTCLRLIATPAAPEVEQGFQFVGPLSHVYSNYFALAAADERGGFGALDIDPTPGLIARFLSRDPAAREFPSWVLHVEPSLSAGD